MMGFRRTYRTLPRLLALGAVGLLAVPTAAQADGTDAEASRIATAGHSLKWNWVPPGKSDRFGHAEVLINAPLPAVRAVVTDYGHYKDLVPSKFHNAHVIAKDAQGTDVYMQVPILHGMVTLWDVTRFGPVRPVGPGIETMEGNFVRGNLKAMNAIFTMRALSDHWTLLKFDLLLLPNLPAPQSAIDEELRDAALQAVDAIHDRAQGHSHWVTWTPEGPGAAGASDPQCGSN